ncbi:aminotransferase class I/II-fold pyridoxal phosphate-dependent enzyme [Roseixanthobacter glucoisosaccharinicivorans]|uniref:aminotransferase class I/II-fold pyridoxal phosphate-dependent enzyme n=1 Tax=Roseixanthobacter glucoisosaccharinicivorans TaxID=3119923 RepID=UPI003726B08B
MITGRTATEIALSIRSAVDAGRLKRGASLPTVRQLAEELGINRNTVAAAYKQLSDSGLVEGRGRQGSRVAPDRTAPPPAASPRDLAGGNPDPALLPDMSSVVRSLGWHQRSYEDPPDDPELLRLLGQQFALDELPMGELWLASGTFDAIGTILRKLLAVGDAVGVEDPCFMTTLGLMRQGGYVPLAMPVDDEGVTPEGLRHALAAGAKAVILTPRAHNPLGGSWSLARFAALREEIRAYPDVLVIEDDHFAVLSRFPPMTLVEPGRPLWAIIRSVSKYIGPDLRLAVVNSSHELSRASLALNAFTSRWVSSILQKSVLAVLTAPGYRQLVASAAGAYERRREDVITALAGRGIKAHGRDGMNVWIPVADEQMVARRLLDAGWTVRTGSVFRLAAPSAIRITTSVIPKPLAEEFARTLDSILREDVVERGA